MLLCASGPANAQPCRGNTLSSEGIGYTRRCRKTTGSATATERTVTLESGRKSMEGIADVLGNLRKKGVSLWSNNGQLHYRAPQGVLTQDEIERLSTCKPHLIALLERASVAQSAPPMREPRPHLDRAPLAFSQLAHWNLYQLRERRAIRQIASATRLAGRIDIAALRKCVAELVRRHAALRTRIVVSDAIPTQQIAKSACNIALEVIDLADLSEPSREAEVYRRIEGLILEPIDVTVDPLFEVELLRLREDEHVLLVAMEHMISDAFSMSILLRELFTAYTQALQGRDFALPAIPVQFADYAAWQCNTRDSWIEKHGVYWSVHLRGCQRCRFPADEYLATDPRLGWGTVRVQIAKEWKTQLREWCRLRHTTLVMSVFTAYAALVLRWCNVSDTVIQYQSDGRISAAIENALGYFASPLYLRLELREGDNFVDLLRRVIEEYCKACEHADHSYIAAQVPAPEFTRNSCFNWVPQGTKRELSGLDGSEYAITCCPVSFVHPMLKSLETDAEPFILLYETEREITGDVCFKRSQLSTSTMERFGRNFVLFIETLLTQPEERVRSIGLLR